MPRSSCSGESGTGKELVARAIHAAPRRATGPFVAVNCAALAGEPDRARSCSATRRARSPARSARTTGCFEAADGGTLFLDEIGDLPLELQAQPAALPAGADDPPGRRHRDRSRSTCGWSPRPTSISPRRWPRARFREDLFYRLNVLTHRAAAAARARRRHRAARALLPRPLRARARRRSPGFRESALRGCSSLRAGPATCAS